VLDIGCGDGVNAIALEKAAHRVMGIEVSNLALCGLRNRFARDGRVPLGQYLNEDVCNIRQESFWGGFDAIISCGLFHCLPRATRLDIHRRVTNRLQKGGFLLFSSLTDELPLPSNHGTGPLEPATHPEIEQLFLGLKIRSIERGTIMDRHLPLVGQHSHAIMWVVAEVR